MTRWLKALLTLVLMAPIAASGWEANLTWNPNSESDLAGYRLYRGLFPCPATGALPNPAYQDVGNVLLFKDSAIPDTATDVCYDITAYDLSGNESGHSTKAGLSKPVPPITAPTNFTQANGVFTWDAVIGAAGYLLRVHEDGTPYDPCDVVLTFCNTPSTLITTTSQAVTLKPSTRYDAWIHAVTPAGVVGPLTGYSVTTPALPPAAPVLVRTPSALTFTKQLNAANPASQSISVSNSQAGSTLTWSVSASQPWITVTPTSGTNNGTINVTVNGTGLTVGAHTGLLTITAVGATGSPQTVSVAFTVTADTTPPATPGGLQVGQVTVSGNFNTEIVITAKKADCPGNVETIAANTATNYVRKVRCKPVVR